jgi:hypothetical protein
MSRPCTLIEQQETRLSGDQSLLSLLAEAGKEERTFAVGVVQAEIELLPVAHLVGDDDLLLEVKDRDTRSIDGQTRVLALRFEAVEDGGHGGRRRGEGRK